MTTYPYEPAQSETEARRWSVLGQCRDKATLRLFQLNAQARCHDLNATIAEMARKPNGYSVPYLLTDMLDEADREARYLRAVEQDKVSPVGRILRSWEIDRPQEAQKPTLIERPQYQSHRAPVTAADVAAEQFRHTPEA
jgi:hypothetical protein